MDDSILLAWFLGWISSSYKEKKEKRNLYRQNIWTHVILIIIIIIFFGEKSFTNYRKKKQQLVTVKHKHHKNYKRFFRSEKNKLFPRTVELFNIDLKCSSKLFSTKFPILYFSYRDILGEVKHS